MRSESTAGESLKTVEITGHSLDTKRTRIETANTEFTIGDAASPVEYLLGSLAACFNVVGALVAEEQGITYDELDIRVEGVLDTAKYKGEATESRAGFQTIRVQVILDSDADDGILQAWLEEVEERCPVADNLLNPSQIDVVITRA